MPSLLERFWQEEKVRVDSVLRTALPGARTKPTSVHRAMRYAVLGGGKRIRPILCVLAYKACGGRGKEVYRAGAAIEMIHSFTLIHDDLPCMDDDELRRGEPTLHVVFGEAIALLAGDALLSLSFELLSSMGVHGATPPADVNAIVHEVARAAGTMGVVGGQVVDVESEGKRVPLSTVRYIHSRKTGALITCSLRVGGLLAGARPEKIKALTRYGQCVGLAFQVVDDIRDVCASSEELGKARARDEDRAKATYPRVVGLESSLGRAHALAQEAKAEATHFGKHSAYFCELADYIVRRAVIRER